MNDPYKKVKLAILHAGNIPQTKKPMTEKYNKVDIAIDGLKASAFRFGDMESTYLKTLIDDHSKIALERDNLLKDKAELLESLDRIARPVWWIQEDQKRKTGSINGINGAAAVALSESANYLQEIARKAIDKMKKKRK